MSFGIYRIGGDIPRRLIRSFSTYTEAVATAKVFYDYSVFSEACGSSIPSASFFTQDGKAYSIERVASHENSN